ncbi:probable chromo domain-containing protein LHP1 [Drosophila guanche]|uniref:Blast:Chromobox protein homolog 1 n=1 Tax=Drosophila guanche TaxID=7266 RepID=A0A3B0JI30_DROGU|nr:probable chromo domain-containing protein LHP1 [Drosophila guanche]SPP75050.1 blast:Chromobox protein homolog 1 [Drosophila guanche]
MRSPRKRASRTNPLVAKEYVVEEIKGKRFYQGETEYFVKWEGFEAESCTWEPMENLGKCIHLLAKFENDINFRKLERRLAKTKNRKAHAAQSTELHNNSGGTLTEPEPAPEHVRNNNWNNKCVQLSESSDDESSPEYEPITPPLGSQPGSRRPLSESFASSVLSPLSSTSCSSKSSATFSKSGCSSSPPQPEPQPALTTKQTPSQTQPVLPTPNQKEEFVDNLETTKKLPRNTDKSRANNSLENAEDCNTPESDKEEPSGLELGQKLERIMHSYRFRGNTYLIVKWMDIEEPVLVDIQEMKQLYKKEIIQYFQKLQRSFDDMVK